MCVIGGTTSIRKRNSTNEPTPKRSPVPGICKLRKYAANQTNKEQLKIEVLRSELLKNEAAVRAYESEIRKYDAAAEAFTA
uniref:Uncharacterized protein n=1 Tax=Romanomermis culicivorax TaxID=13658 RepID=A0A915IG07_ROMCU